MRIARVPNPALALTFSMLLEAEGFHPSPQPGAVKSFVDADMPFSPITIEVPEPEAAEAHALLERHGHGKWLI